jgi:hypothetical protein
VLVESRPVGAQVFVDNAAVGRTPMLIGTVQPGRHIIRLELAGHRAWFTAVDVAAGTRTRVGASLEEQ